MAWQPSWRSLSLSPRELLQRKPLRPFRNQRRYEKMRWNEKVRVVPITIDCLPKTDITFSEHRSQISQPISNSAERQMPRIKDAAEKQTAPQRTHKGTCTGCFIEPLENSHVSQRVCTPFARGYDKLGKIVIASGCPTSAVVNDCARESRICVFL